MEIKLTQAEAVVLEELLQRISRNKALYEDAAEQYVIWQLLAQLEKELAEPHSPDYMQLLEQARQTVRENY